MSRRWLAAAASVMLLALPACSGSDAVAGPAAVEHAEPGGTVRVGILPPRSVAPWLVSTMDPSGTLIVRTMCDQLVQWDVVTGRTKPAIAASWRMTSPTGLILKLQKDLTFSDGRDVKGEDLVTSLSRAADSELASPAGTLLEPVQGAERLRGQRQLSADPEERERLAGITTPSPTTLQITLAANRADYVRTLGHTFASVVPFADYKRDRAALERLPVCVGPYRMTEPWSPDQPVIRLTRSSSYYAANAGYSRQGRGYAETIEFHVFATAAEVLKAYELNAVDVAYLDPASTLSQSQQDDLVVAPTPTIEYIGLPVAQPPFDQPGLRYAMSLALDRRAIASKVYNGQRFPLQRLIPPSAGDSFEVEEDAGDAAPCQNLAPPTAQVDRARQLLADSKSPLAGHTLTLFYNDEYAHKALVTEVADQWRRTLGLTIQLESLSGPEYITRGTSAAGFDGPFRFSWTPQVPGADGYLAPLLSTAGLGADNFSRLTDNQLDFVLEQRARGVADEEVRRVSYLLAEKLACSSMALIPLVQGGRPYLVRHAVLASAVGIESERSTGHVPVRELFLTQEK